MVDILNYLKKTYDPETIIVYGSFADGTQNRYSDFDGLLLADTDKSVHDTTIVGDTVLDVFVYPQSTVFAMEDVTRLHFGKLLLDKNGKGQHLMEQVRRYIHEQPSKSDEQIHEELTWCDKMLARVRRGDAEGYYRWHWLLYDSLEFYCDIRKKFYFGPKKSLRMMERVDSEAFAYYSRALQAMDLEALEQWVCYLKAQMSA